jgi:hypothetical protein
VPFSRIALLCATITCCVALVIALGINRIVVTDGLIAFKSDYFPL